MPGSSEFVALTLVYSTCVSTPNFCLMHSSSVSGGAVGTRCRCDAAKV